MVDKPPTPTPVKSSSSQPVVNPALKWLLVIQTIILVALIITFIYLSFFRG